MKKYGRFLIVYLAIVTVLYGTTNVMPVVSRKDYAYYTGLKRTLNDPAGELQGAGGMVVQGRDPKGSGWVEPPLRTTLVV